MPPSRANAIANLPSVTVSIAALTIGILRSIVRVKRVRVETSRGRTEEAAGTISTSSKVRPSLVNLCSKVFVLCVGDMTRGILLKKTPAHVQRVLDTHHEGKYATREPIFQWQNKS